MVVLNEQYLKIVWLQIQIKLGTISNCELIFKNCNTFRENKSQEEVQYLDIIFNIFKYHALEALVGCTGGISWRALEAVEGS